MSAVKAMWFKSTEGAIKWVCVLFQFLCNFFYFWLFLHGEYLFENYNFYSVNYRLLVKCIVDVLVM